MRNDIIFSCIAIPFTIGFGIASCQPLWAMAIFGAMLLLRYTAAPATAMSTQHFSAGRVTRDTTPASLDSTSGRVAAS